MATSLSTLRTKTQQFLDDTGANAWGTSELDAYINDAQRWLWGELCKEDDSFGLREATATLVQAQATYNYPSDILGRNIRALYAYTSGSDPYIKVSKGTYEEVQGEGSSQSAYPYRYCPMDGYFKVGPPPDASGYTLLIIYTRQPTTLVNVGDNMDSDDEFAEIIACAAAIRALQNKGAETKGLTDRLSLLVNDAAGLTIPDDLIESRCTWKYKNNP